MNMDKLAIVQLLEKKVTMCKILPHCDLVRPYVGKDLGQHVIDSGNDLPESILTYIQWGSVALS